MCWCGRGDREVARRVADNRGARISETGFSRLVKRAENDGILAEKVGLRPDIPPPMFRELLSKATAVVHKRLIASATPEMRAAKFVEVLAKVSERSRRARRPARLSRGAARGAWSAPRRADGRGGVGGISPTRQIRRNSRCTRGARQGADQNRRPADGRRTARSGADPVQSRRPEMGDGEGDHSGAARHRRHVLSRGSMRPLPTTGGCRPQPRIASCAFGRCGRANNRPISRSNGAEKPGSMVRGPRARPWRGSGCGEIRPGFRQSSAHCAVHSKSGDRRKTLQRPGRIIGDIGHKAKFATAPQDAGKLSDHLRPERSAASSGAASARDRDGSGRSAPTTRREATRSGSWRHRSAGGCSADRPAFDRRQRLGHAVDERFDPDKSGRRLRFRLRQQNSRRRRSQFRAEPR